MLINHIQRYKHFSISFSYSVFIVYEVLIILCVFDDINYLNL